MRDQQIDHGVDRLVREDPENEYDLFSGKEIGEPLLKCLHALKIVRAVKQKDRIIPKELHSCRPYGIGKSFPHSLLADLPSSVSQTVHSKADHDGISDLMSAGKIDVHFPAAQKEICSGKVCPEDLCLPDIHEMRLRMLPFAGIQKDLHHFPVSRIEYDVTPFLNDAGLDRGNLSDRVPQIVGMLKSHIHDHTDFRSRDHVGRIPASTESDLNDRYVTSHFPEIEKCKCRRLLKIRRRILHALCSFPYDLPHGSKFPVGDLPAGCAYFFIFPHKERRSVETGHIPCPCQHLVQHDGG